MLELTKSAKFVRLNQKFQDKSIQQKILTINQIRTKTVNIRKAQL